MFYVILSIYLLAGVDNRNVIITQRFHAAPDQANRDFFWSLTAYCNCKYFSTFLLSPLRPAERGGGVLKVLREENLFFTTNMAAVSSRENQSRITFL